MTEFKFRFEMDNNMLFATNIFLAVMFFTVLIICATVCAYGNIPDSPIPAEQGK